LEKISYFQRDMRQWRK